MSTAIQELRPDSLDAAAAFATAAGCRVDRGRVIPMLSLVAVEGEQMVAAALCVELAHRRHRVEVAVNDLPNRAALHRSLVDKALMKIAAAGVRTFDIRTNGHADQTDFWNAVSWIDQTLSPDTGTPGAPGDTGAPGPSDPASEVADAA
jgi:hypothetical protein